MTRFSYVVSRGSVGRWAWYGLAVVWILALGLVYVDRTPFGLVFGPLFLLYGASGLIFHDDGSEWLAPLFAIGFLVVGTVLTAASLALVS